MLIVSIYEQVWGLEMKALLAALEQRGVRLTVEGERLRWEGPKGAMTPELLASLRAHRAGLLAALAGSDEGDPPQCQGCEEREGCSDRQRIMAGTAG